MPTLDLHIGAHKTATTFLQVVMQTNQDLFEAEGFVVPHHRKVRKFLTIPSWIQLASATG